MVVVKTLESEHPEERVYDLMVADSVSKLPAEEDEEHIVVSDIRVKESGSREKDLWPPGPWTDSVNGQRGSMGEVHYL